VVRSVSDSDYVDPEGQAPEECDDFLVHMAIKRIEPRISSP
jgi:hypothetical protein